MCGSNVLRVLKNWFLVFVDLISEIVTRWLPYLFYLYGTENDSNERSRFDDEMKSKEIY